MAKYWINFDVNYFVKINAKSPEEAIEIVKKHLSKYINQLNEGEAHDFGVEKVMR